MNHPAVDSARLCPKCGAPNVDFTLIAGPNGKATCRGCAWSGKFHQLVVVMGTEGQSVQSGIQARSLFIQRMGTAFETGFVTWGVEVGLLDPKSPKFKSDALELLKAGVMGAFCAIVDRAVELKDEQAKEKGKTS
mgnify:CR=1 FL=1